ncbi:MAG: C25 family peptidase propeptide domain-containing protein, partial [Candidatus Cloacimonadaceae bacterium]|nr:C25 family peptidase propeptide domain-containing protein [Candidatus Cloacimonadaceae bacterium]
MKKLMLVAIFAILVIAATASVIYSVSPDQFELRENGEFKSIKLNNGQTWGEPGDPELSWIGVKLLLPINHEASDVIVHRSNPQTIILDSPIKPLQQQYPLSTEQIMPKTLPNPIIYTSDKSFPAKADNGIRTEFLAGHPIAFTAICPFDYNPVRNELTFYRNISIEVQTAPSSKAFEASRFLKQEAFISKYLSRSVDNQDAVPMYEHRTDGYEYIIVIDQAKITQWTPLKDFYEDRGYTVLFKSIQDITAQYTGVDTQDKIRNFFIDM